MQSLTGDGGKLKCYIPLVRGRDFEIVPEPVWKALVQWYTGSPSLPRNVTRAFCLSLVSHFLIFHFKCSSFYFRFQVIIPTDGDPTPILELFPRLLLLYRHAQPPAKNSFQSWSGMGFGLSGLSFGASTGTTAASIITPRRQLSYTAVFSKMNTLQQVRFCWRLSNLKVSLFLYLLTYI